MTAKIEAARAVYLNDFVATKEQLKSLGFDTEPSKEYLQERTLEILAEAYVKGMF